MKSTNQPTNRVYIEILYDDFLYRTVIQLHVNGALASPVVVAERSFNVVQL